MYLTGVLRAPWEAERADTGPGTADQTVDAIVAKVLGERDVKDGILALQDRLRVRLCEFTRGIVTW